MVVKATTSLGLLLCFVWAPARCSNAIILYYPIIPFKFKLICLKVQVPLTTLKSLKGWNSMGYLLQCNNRNTHKNKTTNHTQTILYIHKHIQSLLFCWSTFLCFLLRVCVCLSLSLSLILLSLSLLPHSLSSYSLFLICPSLSNLTL